MYCKNCFKKISPSSRYCKYCGSPVENKREFPFSPKILVIIIIAIVLIASAAVVINSSVFRKADSIKYTDYIGTWQERGAKDIETKGGVRLEILSVSGDTMIISMDFFDGGAEYNSIQVHELGAVIKDGKAYYSFANDGFGNSGNGVLTFEGRDIKWKSIVNKNDPVYYNVSKVNSSAPAEEPTTAPDAGEQEKPVDQGTSSDDQYILPDSDKRLLTEADLKDLTQEELRLARNEIMARHGRKFNDPTLTAYFESKKWYNGNVEPAQFDSGSYLSDIEIKNVELIKRMEE